MSLFGANALKPLNTTKRKEMRTVTQPGSSRPSPQPQNKPATAQRTNGASKGPPLDRFKMTPSTKKPMSKPMSKPVAVRPQQAKIVRTSQKRKIETPPPTYTPLSSDSEGEDDVDVGAAEEERRRKRLRAEDTHRDPGRHMRDVEHWTPDEHADLEMIHSSTLTTDPKSKDFRPIFPDEPEAEVLLQYPSTSKPERFRLYQESGHDGYNALDDLRRTMELILHHYLPPSPVRTDLLSDTGLTYTLSSTRLKKSLPAIRETIKIFNDLIFTSLSPPSSSSTTDNNNDNNPIANKLDTLPHLPLQLVERVMSQTYSRTVSPRTDLLKHYTTGSDNTYGELQPLFCSQIFRETALTSDKIFLDLGSGVGNVVIQAALETGCEAYGVESVKEWHDLGVLQAQEFRERSRLWGLSAGQVHLEHSDFLSCPLLNTLLPRVDVVVVNNFKFSASTNDSLKLLFLALKEGAKVVSLRSFVSGELKERNMNDLGSVFEVQQKWSFENCVSWEGDAVEWFLGVKDSGRIERILGKDGRARR